MSRVPRIRFKGFEEDWEQRKWIDVVDISKDMVDPRNGKYDNLPHISPGNIESFTGQLYDNVKCVKDENLISGKFKFSSGDIIYGKINPQLGKYLYATFSGLTSADAYVLNAKNNVTQKYLYTVIQTRNFFEYSVSVSMRSGMPKINRDELNAYSFFVPLAEEQLKIGNCILKYDRLITLHQRKLEKLKIIKKSMLENIFPQNGEKTPKIRFSGFTEDWEQRKLGEIVVIERGGSPRPIEKYITESNDGLNWIKIGDAPVQGRYITKTSEKIKKSGLSKTRQVFPGDLILSNSMSFGKPYIMGIEGCIHDGWLVIKNRNNVFDLKFLCHMLSTEYLFNQYKMFAAGSTVNNLNKELVGNASVRFPKMLEQRKIGKNLESLDHLITLHQSKLGKLQEIKKSMLESMFV